MKRWQTLLGRGGTILIAISLALLLISLIPPIPLSYSMRRTASVRSKSYATSYENVLSPQESLEYSVTANGTLTIYILEVHINTLQDWINEQEPEPSGDSGFTRLEGFLEENPESVGHQEEMQEGKINYIPTKVTNVTVVFSNPSPDYITLEYTSSIVNVLAPSDKVRNIALWTTPIGLILAIPWLANIWKQRKQK